jgi:hypothetical protein
MPVAIAAPCLLTCRAEEMHFSPSRCGLRRILWISRMEHAQGMCGEERSSRRHELCTGYAKSMLGFVRGGEPECAPRVLFGAGIDF